MRTRGQGRRDRALSAARRALHPAPAALHRSDKRAHSVTRVTHAHHRWFLVLVLPRWWHCILRARGCRRNEENRKRNTPGAGRADDDRAPPPEHGGAPVQGRAQGPAVAGDIRAPVQRPCCRGGASARDLRGPARRRARGVLPRERAPQASRHRRTPSCARARPCQNARTAGGGESASLALRAALGGDASARPPLSMQLDTIRALAYATHLMNVAEDAEVSACARALVLRGRAAAAGCATPFPPSLPPCAPAAC